MKKPIALPAILTALFFCLISPVWAQLSIGTTTPSASARLQIDASPTTNAKGFLPPRVALSGLNSILPFSAAPADGLLVYNTATAGTAPDDVTPGFYYYNGSRWQRIINDFNGYVGIGTSTPSVRLDARASSGDAAIGVGSSSLLPATAGGGALRYNATSGELEYSNASTWQTLSVGNAPKYAQFLANARQTFTSAGTKMNFPTTTLNIGGFSIATNNTITLPAGRVYRVDLNLGWFNGGWCRFAVYNASTNVALSPTAHFEGSGAASIAGSGTVSTFINTASGSISIDVRYVAPGVSIEVSDSNNGGNYASITIQTVD